MLTTYGTTLGCSFCPTTGKVLNGPVGFGQLDHEKLWETTAEACPSYGANPPQSSEMKSDAVIAIGDPGISVTLSQKGNIASIDRPMSCTACQWFVPADVVTDELGYQTPMCAAKGKLLFARNLVREAANCGSGLNGSNTRTCLGVILNAEYVKVQAPWVPMPVAVVVDLVIEADKHSVDPRLYVTDRPVTPEDEIRCIRAWRAVADPEGLRSDKFLPIYDGTKLCGFDPRTTYGGHRPDLYVDHHGILYDLVCELARNETPCFNGGAGTGKSETGPWLAWLMDLPHERIDIKKGYEASHLTGQGNLVTDPTTGTPITVFTKARFSATYDKPGITTINEPNLAGECFEVLRPIFDNAKQFGMDEASGQAPIERHWARYILIAQNPNDPMYVGTEPLSAADIDRLSPVKFELPSEAVERQIIRRHCDDAGYAITDDMLDKIMLVAHDLRGMIEEGTLPIAWGLRAQIKVAKKTQDYSFEKAYRRAITDGLEDAVANMILPSVKSVAND